MRICGLNKTSLLDYPGKVAATIFLAGCNFRCPFCQNGSLVLYPEQQPAISPDEILRFLQKRKGVLDGVCVTGGEPTLQKDLPDFLRKIKELGYKIKLDTNGSRPQFLKAVVKEGLVDAVAMDIKSSRESYPLLTGITHLNLAPICESAAFLMDCGIDYEFRTTVVRELHREEDFFAIRQWLSGAKAYYLQAYRDSEEVIHPGFSSYTRQELEHFREILSSTIPLVEIRGID